MSDMKRRFSLYGMGFFMGLVLVFFFLGGKNAACEWMPNKRILRVIRNKTITFSADSKDFMQKNAIDSVAVYTILKDGNIDFSQSHTKNDPCRSYLINGVNAQKDLTIIVQICDTIAEIHTIRKQLSE